MQRRYWVLYTFAIKPAHLQNQTTTHTHTYSSCIYVYLFTKQITWIDGSENVLTAAVEYEAQPTADNRRFTAKSIIKLKANKEFHNKTIMCQAQNTVDKTHQSASIRLEVSVFSLFIFIIVDFWIFDSMLCIFIKFSTKDFWHAKFKAAVAVRNTGIFIRNCIVKLFLIFGNLFDSKIEPYPKYSCFFISNSYGINFTNLLQ